MAALGVEGAMALQDELIEAYRAQAVQRRLQRFAAGPPSAPGGEARQAAAEREAFLLELQKPLVAKFGFDASAKGVQDAMIAFAKDEVAWHPAVIKRNNHMERLLLAGGPLDYYSTTWQLWQIRDPGQHRPPPVNRFPLVEVEEDRFGPHCIKTRVPRTGILSSADAGLLAAACLAGDAAAAARLLGARRVGSSAKAVLANVGYRGLNSAGGKTLGRALGRDLESLELDASGNDLGTEGARGLAAGLPPQLRVLKLNVSNNRVGLLGAQALANALPQSLEVLHLGLAGVPLGAEGARALAERLPPRLMDLSLDLTGCAVGDEGMLALARALPQSIEDLTLTLRRNNLSRRGLLCVDRQIGDPKADGYLPRLTSDRFRKTAELEVYEFQEEEDGHLVRQLDWRTNF